VFPKPALSLRIKNGDWKVAITCRQECLHYATTIFTRFFNPPMNCGIFPERIVFQLRAMGGTKMFMKTASFQKVQHFAVCRPVCIRYRMVYQFEDSHEHSGPSGERFGENDCKKLIKSE
jgi:hypothetical protein